MQQVQRFMKCLTVETRSQLLKKRTGICEASSTESRKRRYFPNTHNAALAGHLHNDPLARSHHAVSRAKAVYKRQAIAAPLNVNDSHVAGDLGQTRKPGKIGLALLQESIPPLLTLFGHVVEH